MRIRSLRFKLSWISGLIIAIVFICLGLIRYQIFSYRTQQRFDQDLLREARIFARYINASPEGFEMSSIGTATADVLAMERLRPYFVVTDSQGRVLRQEFYGWYMQRMLVRKDLQQMLHQRDGYSVARASDGTVYRFVSLPIGSSGGDTGLVLHLGRSLDSLQNVVREFLVIYAISVPLILAVSIGVGWLLAGKALKPFGEIADTAAHITTENLNTRIESPHKEEEIEKLVASFNKMVGRLNRSFQQMKKFNADAAHELRTPLAILQGETEIALRNASLSEEARSVLASNLEELERLTRIVNDLLTLSEAEAGNQRPARKPVRMKHLLEDLLEQLHIFALEKGIRVSFEGPEEVEIEGDELWIRRAVVNLLDNAIKYSKENGEIRIGLKAEGNRAKLVISDDGIGISEKDLPHIFDRLYRADPARARDTGGVGLGLSLVKWVVTSHRGGIRVSSVLDQGTRFEIEFPLLSVRAHAS